MLFLVVIHEIGKRNGLTLQIKIACANLIFTGCFSLLNLCFSNSLALAGVAQLLGASSCKQKVSGLSSGQGTCLGCGFSSAVRVHTKGTRSMFLTLTFFSLTLSLPSPLPKINKPILR